MVSKCKKYVHISIHAFFNFQWNQSFKKGSLHFQNDIFALHNGLQKSQLTSIFDGSFSKSPDQIIPGKGGAFSYFTEYEGRSVGIHVIDTNNKQYAIFEAYLQKYYGYEMTGLVFSPGGKKKYACFQDIGVQGL
ncbi:LOW QUALITY PROTEIN: hypothetical protein ACHAW6_005721 [Cyclotella cf. meneghiniana]